MNNTFPTSIGQAYMLEPRMNGRGKEVLQLLLTEIENRRGELVVAFAGYVAQMEALFQFNDGLPGRFPKTWRFGDYSDDVLLDIFKGLMAKRKGKGKLHFSATNKDKARWAKVAIARLGRQRGTPGFGNARAVGSLFDKVMERQADRLCSIGALSYHDLDQYEFQKSDLLGTSVADLEESKDWRALRDMIGLSSVKNAVRALAELVDNNRLLEEQGKPPRVVALNRCMLGNPGTGKVDDSRVLLTVGLD